MMQLKKITSRTNARIKNVVSLREKRNRVQTNSIIVEGLREITRAKEAEIVFKEVFVSSDKLKTQPIHDMLMQLSSGGALVYELSENVFEKISFGDRSEGILCVCESKFYSLDDLSTQDKLLLIIVESVEKPGNLGAILRTADCAGVDGIFVCDTAVDIYNPNVIRASLGAVFSQKVVVASKEDILDFCRENQIKIVASTPSAKKVYTKIDFVEAAAIVVGSEQEGLSPFWINNAQVQALIPMSGHVDSLNVSSAMAVIIYEAIRQRSQE